MADSKPIRVQGSQFNVSGRTGRTVGVSVYKLASTDLADADDMPPLVEAEVNMTLRSPEDADALAALASKLKARLEAGR